MEHIDLPSNCGRHCAKIPLLAIEEYDGGDFRTYPDRVGWRTAISIRSWARNPNPFIQTWLFFGLITALLGRKASFNEFTISEGRQRFITTKTLRNRAASFVSDGKRSLTRLREAQEAVACLKEAYDMFNTFLQMSYLWEIEPQLALSISVIGEFLSETMFHAYWDIIPVNKSDGNVFSAAFAPEPITSNDACFTADEISGSLAKFNTFMTKDWAHRNMHAYSYQKMCENGWCKRKALRCLMTFSATGVYYASYFDNPCSERKHEDCTQKICSANQLDESHYQTIHALKGCTCKHVDASEADLFLTLLSKSFPLVEFVNTLGNYPVLNVTKFVPGMKYVAISHVWSDGLGNPNSNSLPRCQLTRISNLVQQLCGRGESRRIPFWIDTICCPVKPQDALDLAISKMRETYMEAEWVLVLDSWLQSQPIMGLTDEEVLLRIACSNWNERLWTLQEGMLAQKIAFQFSDSTFYNIGRAVEKIWSHPRPSSFGLRQMIVNEFQHLCGFRDMKSGSSTKLLMIRDTLKFRDTSVASDEAICLGTLLGCDMNTILTARKEDRMRAFWSTFTEIPSQLVFWGAPRLNLKGFGWAPTTMRHPYAQGPQLAHAPYCHLLKAFELGGSSGNKIPGLSIQADGFLLSTPRLPLWETFQFFDSCDNLYGAECNPLVSGVLIESGTMAPTGTRGRQERLDLWERSGHLPTMCLGLISAYSPDLTGMIPVHDLYNAVLIAVLQQCEDTLITEIIRPVHLSFEKDPAMIAIRKFALTENRRTKHVDPISVENGCIAVIGKTRSLPQTQKWIIL